MRRLLFVLLCFLAIPAWGQETSEAPTMPNLRGMTAAQAHAVLHEHGLRLDPLIIPSNEGTGHPNTIIDQSLAAGEAITEGAVISVTILREYNLQLIWNSEEYEDNAFTVVNLIEQQINLEQLLFVKADNSRQLNTVNWPNFLRERQCVQLWTFNESNGYRLPECQFLQGGGILSVQNQNQQFWRGEGSFYVLQEGLRRAECQIAAGSCQLWVSPSAIAEDFSPYVFLIYNQHELIIHNRSETQWLPLNQLALNESEALNDAREWDSLDFTQDLPFLAPNQCVRFSDGSSPSLADCVEVASRNVEDVFWQNGFAVHSLHNGDVSKNCPAAVGNEPTICLLLR